MEIILSIHSIIRWLVIVSGLLTFLDLLKDKPRFLKLYTIIFDIQAFVGLILWIHYLINLQGINFKDFHIRFFAIEHPFLMLLALTFAHISGIKARKGNIWKVSFVVSFVIVLASIPWWRGFL